jgi:hypothetical protein
MMDVEEGREEIEALLRSEREKADFRIRVVTALGMGALILVPVSVMFGFVFLVVGENRWGGISFGTAWLGIAVFLFVYDWPREINERVARRRQEFEGRTSFPR